MAIREPTQKNKNLLWQKETKKNDNNIDTNRHFHFFPTYFPNFKRETLFKWSVVKEDLVIGSISGAAYLLTKQMAE